MIHPRSFTFAVAALVTSGCVAEVATFAPEVADEDARNDDPVTIDAIAKLIIDNAHATTGATLSIADATTIDSDGDGIADATEELMLRRYRPYYRFSQAGGEDEQYRPANAVDVIEQAQLLIAYDNGGGTSAPIASCGRAGDHHLVPAESLYACAPDASLAVWRAKSSYALNLANVTYPGVSLDQAAHDATGLYGHVAPATINGHDAYKIEYWQYFAFNNQDITILGVSTSFGDHEGDWTSVQLWFDLALHRIARVRYLIHGKVATFDVPAVTPSCTGCIVDVHGASYDPDPPNFFDNQAPYTNNAAQFFIDVNAFKHVVVYIERGGHEMWPGPWGHAAVDVAGISIGLNPHNGAGPSYLVPDVTDRLFNLGEAERPLTRDGQLILPYNGFWGATNTHEAGFWGPVQRSPVGPALHCSWRWASNTAISGCEN